LIKPDRPDQGIRDESLQVAYYVLDKILRMLHPFIPFATEEIYHNLTEHLGDRAETITLGPWPDETKDFFDESLEKSFESIQTVVNAVRSLRAEMNVPPGKRSDLHVRITKPEIGQLLEKYQTYFRSLAKINELHVGEDIKKPGLSASAVISGAEIFVPLEGLIDVEAEKARLEKELTNLKNQLDRLSKKLANQDFLKNAPGEIVEKEKSKKADIEDRVEKLNSNLEQLVGW
jgi:valyl-tRNA synthetase